MRMGVVVSRALVIMSSTGSELLDKSTNHRSPHVEGALAGTS